MNLLNNVFRRATGGPLSMTLASATVVGMALVADQPSSGALAVWDGYVAALEQRVDRELAAESSQPFFAYERLDAATRARAQRELTEGSVFVARGTAPPGVPHDPPGALLHHWLGAILVPGATVDQVLAFVQDYDHHHQHYEDVVASRTLARDGDRYRAFLQLKRTKVVTVHYNTEHDVIYRRLASDRASSLSRATKIAELEHPGTPRVREKKLGEDAGYLWRLNSYWRFKQVPKGVIVECESVSLSRDIPWMLAFVRPFVTSIPRESLERTLTDMRKGIAATAAARPRSKQD